MTPRSQSQPKANGDHGDRHGRKFMLVGIAAFLATAITMSAGLMLTNKAKAHLRKERQAYEMVDRLASYESNSVGPYHLVLDIHSPNWSGVVDSIESVREHAALDHGWMVFADVRMKNGGYFTPFFVGDGVYATAILISGPNAEAKEKASTPYSTSRVDDGNPAKGLVLHAKPVAKPATATGFYNMCNIWPCWGEALPKERP
jgi:hypothetical protein